MGDGFRVRDCLVEPQLNRIHCGQRIARVEPKAMDVLVYLARHPNEVLPKERIIQAVWPDVSVTDDVLTHAISELRKALEETGQYRSLRQGLLHESCLSMGPKPSDSQKPGNERSPRFSPDGNYVTFSWNGQGGDNWDIYVQTIDTRELNRRTDDPADDFNPAWSPDGRYIAFGRSDGETERLLLIPQHGEREHVLITTRVRKAVRNLGKALLHVGMGTGRQVAGFEPPG